MPEHVLKLIHPVHGSLPDVVVCASNKPDALIEFHDHATPFVGSTKRLCTKVGIPEAIELAHAAALLLDPGEVLEVV